MIISQTPYRVSLFGGGTDLEAWSSKFGGAVISTTIDKYCHISLRSLPPFFDHKHRLVYSKIESVKNIEEIEHPSIKAVLKLYEVGEGLEIHHDGDLPARSGLGSSSSFTVGLLNAMSAKFGRIMSKQELAMEAINVEQHLIGEAVGSQDQIAAAYGGFNHIEFHSNGEFEVTPIALSHENTAFLQSHMMLFYTRQQRRASEIEKRKIKQMDKLEKEFSEIAGVTRHGLSILQNDSLDVRELSSLLDCSWQLKRSLSSAVSNAIIDQAYSTALSNGALGGKLLGAGGGGFMLLLVPPEQQDRMKEVLMPFLNVPFCFEQLGSIIPVNKP